MKNIENHNQIITKQETFSPAQEQVLLTKEMIKKDIDEKLKKINEQTNQVSEIPEYHIRQIQELDGDVNMVQSKIAQEVTAPLQKVREIVGNKFAKIVGVLGFGGIMYGHQLYTNQFPEKLERDGKSISIETVYGNFSPETKKELYELEKEYINKYYKIHNISDTIDTNLKEELSNHFQDFVARYGEGVTIVLAGQEKNFYSKINNYLFNLTESPDRAHYANSHIFYNKNEKKREKNLHDFLAELAHHVNNDAKIGRNLIYGKNLLDVGFKQHEIYDSPSTIEYQAHSITERAMELYLLYTKPGELKNISFDNIYNSSFKLYRFLRENKRVADAPDIQEVENQYFAAFSGELSDDKYENGERVRIHRLYDISQIVNLTEKIIDSATELQEIINQKWKESSLGYREYILLCGMYDIIHYSNEYNKTDLVKKGLEAIENF